VLVTLLFLIMILAWGEGTEGRTILAGTTDTGEFGRITEALNNSTDGDIILIPPGQYLEEEIVLNRSVSLIGSGVEKTRISARKGIRITANETSLSDLSITLGYFSDCPPDAFCYLTPEGEGIEILSSRNELRNLTISVLDLPVSLVDSHENILVNLSIESDWFCKCWLVSALYVRDSSNNRFSRIDSPSGQGITFIGSDGNIITDCSFGSISLDECDDTLIRRNRIRDTGLRSTGTLLMTSHFTTIIGNEIRDHSTGIAIYSSNGSRIEENVLADGDMMDDDSAITALDSPVVKCFDNTIMNYSKGVRIERSAFWDIRSNRIMCANDTAIDILDSEMTTIRSSGIVYAFSGISIVGSDGCRVRENSMSHPLFVTFDPVNATITSRENISLPHQWSKYRLEHRGLYVDASMDVIVEENYAEEYCIGIHISASEEVHLVKNRMTKNHFGLVMEGDCERFRVRENRMAGNSKGIHCIDPPVGSLDGRENYWGDDSGPYHPIRNPDGKGDTFTHEIIFEPWLSFDGNLTYIQPVEEPRIPPSLFPPPPLLLFLVILLVSLLGILTAVVSLPPTHQALVGHPVDAEGGIGIAEMGRETITDPEIIQLIICQYCGDAFSLHERDLSIRLLCPNCGEFTVSDRFR
jgi:parallel beta-helix repeat protein